mgnify:FL=1|jgi:hypothetical protein
MPNKGTKTAPNTAPNSNPVLAKPLEATRKQMSENLPTPEEVQEIYKKLSATGGKKRRSRKTKKSKKYRKTKKSRRKRTNTRRKRS